MTTRKQQIVDRWTILLDWLLVDGKITRQTYDDCVATIQEWEKENGPRVVKSNP